MKTLRKNDKCEICGKRPATRIAVNSIFSNENQKKICDDCFHDIFIGKNNSEHSRIVYDNISEEEK